MNLEYYSGFKEEVRFGHCMDILGETGTEIKRYDRLKDTLYITMDACLPEEKSIKIQKAFIKAGYLDIKVEYKKGKTK